MVGAIVWGMHARRGGVKTVSIDRDWQGWVDRPWHDQRLCKAHTPLQRSFAFTSLSGGG